MARTKRPEKESPIAAVENHPSVVVTGFRVPPEEEAKALEVDRLQLEVSRLRLRAAKPAEGGRSKETPNGAFTHSPDYRSVTVRSKTFTLTSKQAQTIQILHEAAMKGTPEVGIEYILVQLAGDNRAESSRWQDTFKSNPTAKRALVRSGNRKGTLRLKL